MAELFARRSEGSSHAKILEVRVALTAASWAKVTSAEDTLTAHSKVLLGRSSSRLASTPPAASMNAWQPCSVLEYDAASTCTVVLGSVELM